MQLRRHLPPRLGLLQLLWSPPHATGPGEQDLGGQAASGHTRCPMLCPNRECPRPGCDLALLCLRDTGPHHPSLKHRLLRQPWLQACPAWTVAAGMAGVLQRALPPAPSQAKDSWEFRTQQWPGTLYRHIHLCQVQQQCLFPELPGSFLSSPGFSSSH